MQNVKTAIAQIDRLLAGYPAPSNVDARTRFAAYLTAIEDYDGTTIVREAVTNFIKRRVADHNPDFAPSPSRLAGECSRILTAQITEQQRRKQAVLQIEQRDEQFHMDPPELRRIAVAEGLARLTAINTPEETAEEAMARRARNTQHLAKHDSYFMKDDTDDSRRKRLMGHKAH